VLWIFLDVALAVVCLLVLGLVGFGLYRHTRVLLRTLGAGATTLGDASAGLDAAHSDRLRQD
jgi:hypothetical protein